MKIDRACTFWVVISVLLLSQIVPAANAGITLEADASYSLTVSEPTCDLSALPLGGVCNDGTRNVVYIGQLSGTRLYTTTIEPVPSSFSTAAILTDAVSRTNGIENTNKLLARTDATYPMAQSCRSLGAKWYLPGIDELSVLFSNKAAVMDAAGMSLYQYVDVYYSSSDFSADYAYHLNMVNGAIYYYSHPKYPNWTFKYRCFRRD